MVAPIGVIKRKQFFCFVVSRRAMEKSPTQDPTSFQKWRDLNRVIWESVLINHLLPSNDSGRLGVANPKRHQTTVARNQAMSCFVQ